MSRPRRKNKTVLLEYWFQAVRFFNSGTCHQLTEKLLHRDSRAGVAWVGAKRKPNKIHKSFQLKLRLLDKTWLAKHRAVDSRIRGNDGILMILIENYGRAVIPECGYDGTGLDDAL